jgi:hypothetical protein
LATGAHHGKKFQILLCELDLDGLPFSTMLSQA